MASYPIQAVLLDAAIFFAVVKIAATIWLVRQPDATTVTARPGGRMIYYAGKVSPILFVAAMLARASIQGDSAGVKLWAVLLVIAVVSVIVVVRQRAAGTWYGVGHAMKQKRRQQRDHQPPQA